MILKKIKHFKYVSLSAFYVTILYMCTGVPKANVSFDVTQVL